MSKNATRLVSIIALGLLPLAAVAQQSASTTDETRQGWSGSGELGLAIASGNSRSENLNAKLAFKNEDDRWKHSYFASAVRSKGEVTDDFNGDGVKEERYDLSANRYQLGASSAYKLDPKNYVVGAARYENDDFSSYDYQATVSVGYGHQFIQNQTTSLLTEIGPGYRRARDSETGEVQNGAIARGLVDFKHALTDNTDLVNTLLIEAGSDNTFAQDDFGVSVAMNEAFALKAGVQVRHNTNVDEDAGVKKTDTLSTVNLVYSFK